jgi:hypothetical protein
MRRFLSSLLYGLIRPWLGVAAFYAVIGVFLGATGLYLFVAGWFHGLVFVWVFAWLVFLIICHAKRLALTGSAGSAMTSRQQDSLE